MGTWISSRVSGYRVAGGVGAFVPDFYSMDAPGTKDTQIITRGQYNISGALGPTKFVNMRTQMVFSMTHGELYDNGYFVDDDEPVGGLWVKGPYRISARLYIVSAANYKPGVVPTPGQILAGGSGGHGGVRVYVPKSKYTDTGVFQSGTRTFTWDFDAPSPDNFQPGQKYWLMMMPVRYYRPEGLSTITRIFTTIKGQNGTTIGRGCSFWMNRKQSAPVITSPVSGNQSPPGSDLDLVVDFGDPDKVGTSKTPDALGVNGVQVQIRPRPNQSAPNPPWTDMLMYSTNTAAQGPSPQKAWTILGSTINRLMASDLIYGALRIRTGGDPFVGFTPRGYIPEGEWQIRVRSFDPGMPWNYLSSGVRPVNGVARDWTPDTYFNALTSPWSTPVDIFIPSQVPPPIPLSPLDNNAVVQGEPLRLNWKYRNTAVPPFGQLKRTVQLRVAGVEEWTTLATGDGSLPYFDVLGVLAPGAYEWRVEVTDTDNVTSDFSEIASFLVVPAPNTGVVRPIPDNSIEGATLGCGKHRAFVYRRGGKKRVAEITEISHLDWARLRDDMSTSKIVVSGWTVDCGNLLKILQTWAYEIVIFRDNGYSVDRVWEGPITLLTYEQDKVTIDAKDVMAYPYRRIIKQVLNDTANGDTVVNRAVRVLQNTLGPDDPNVLQYLTPLFSESDAREYRSTPAYSRTAFEEIDDMAANAGLDYTATGRRIMVWSTRARIGTLPEFKDSDFGAPPIVSEYGMSMANVYAVSDGNGLYGVATRLDENNQDTVYGLIEMLSSTWASDTQAEHGTLTEEGKQTVIASFEEFAERSIADRYPPPVVVRVPDNTSLNPSAVVTIQQLVPGVVIPLRSSSTLREVRGNQKLDAVKVIEEAGTETISITMSPFNRDDAAVVEGEAT